MKIKKILVISSILLSIIPMVCVVFLFGIFFSQSIEYTFETNLTSSVSLYAHTINSFFEQQINMLNLTREIPTVKYLFEASLFNNTLKDTDTQDRKIFEDYLLTCVEKDPAVSSVSFVNKNLLIFMSSEPRLIGTKAAEGLRLLNRAPESYNITDIQINSIGDSYEKLFTISVPVWTNNNQEFLGNIIYTYNMHAFLILTQKIPFFKSEYYFLIDSKGNYAAKSAPSEQEHSLSTEPTLESASAQFTVLNTKSTTASGFLSHIQNGQKVILYYQPISISNWLLVGSIQTDEMYQTRNFTIQLLVTLSIIIGSIVFIISFFAIRLIISPLDMLPTTIQHIQDGDLSARFSYNKNDEFGHIAHMFNNLLDNIEQKTSELEQQAEQLRQSNARYRIIADHTKEIIFEWDFRTDEADYSVTWWKKFGYDPCTKNVSTRLPQEIIIHPDDKKVFSNWVKSIFKSTQISREEFRILAADEQYYWVQVRTIPVCDNEGYPIKLIGLIQDIDEIKVKQKELLSQAQFDFLSTVYNKGTFEKISQEVLMREKQVQAAFIFIDIDDFRVYNTKFGHAFGDRVINFIGTILKQSVQGKGFAGRVGGDEFILCITNMKTLSSLKEFLKKLAESLQNGLPLRKTEKHISVKCSMGIVFYPDTALTFKDLCAKADELMYQVKHKGKSGFAFADSANFAK